MLGRARRTWIAATVTMAAWLSPFVVCAQDARAALTYERGDGETACPDEPALRDAVSARLGYVPFDDGASRSVRVRLARSGRVLGATIEVIERGASTGSRELVTRARPDACPITEALVLAVSLAIDPMTLARAPDPPIDDGDCPEVTACPECAPPERTEPCAACPACAIEASTAPSRPSGRLVAAAVLGLGPLPQPTFAVRLGAGARLDDLSIDVELRGDVPTTGGDDEGRTASATWLTGTIALCGHLDVLALCALSSMGALVGWGGGVDRPATQATGFASVGARLGIEVMLDAAFGLTVSADTGYVVTPTELVVDGRTLHATPPVVGTLGAGVVLRLL